MLLPEAVRQARKELGLSQQKLADAAGIQRRQLATLESGRNVTLSTVRKVLAQLPNLRSFTLDGVTVDVAPLDPHVLAADAYGSAIEHLGLTLARIGARLRSGIPLSLADVAAMDRANGILGSVVRAVDGSAHVPHTANAS